MSIHVLVVGALNRVRDHDLVSVLEGLIRDENVPDQVFVAQGGDVGALLQVLHTGVIGDIALLLHTTRHVRDRGGLLLAPDGERELLVFRGSLGLRTQTNEALDVFLLGELFVQRTYQGLGARCHRACTADDVVLVLEIERVNRLRLEGCREVNLEGVACVEGTVGFPVHANVDDVALGELGTVALLGDSHVRDGDVHRIGLSHRQLFQTERCCHHYGDDCHQSDQRSTQADCHAGCILTVHVHSFFL